MSDILYHYDASKNPEGLALEGVPLRDLTSEDVARLSKHQLGGVELCAFYVPAAVATAARRSRSTGPSETKEATE